MSVPLRQEVLTFVYRSIVGHLPIFQYCHDPQFHDEMLRAMKPLYVHPGERIITQGAADTDCFLVVKGTLDVLYTPNAIGGSRMQTTFKGPRTPSWQDVPSSAEGANKAKFLLSDAASQLRGASKGGKEGKDALPTETEPGTNPSVSNEEHEWVPSSDFAAIAEKVAELGPGDMAGEILPLANDVFGNSLQHWDPRAPAPAKDQSPKRAVASLRRNMKKLRHTRTASVEATDHCELFVMEGEALNRIFSIFAEIRTEILVTAKARVRELREYDMTAQHYARLYRVARSFAHKISHGRLPTTTPSDRALGLFTIACKKDKKEETAGAPPADGAQKKGSMVSHQQAITGSVMPQAIGNNLSLLNHALTAPGKSDHGTTAAKWPNSLSSTDDCGTSIPETVDEEAPDGDEQLVGSNGIKRAVREALQATLDGPLRGVQDEIAALRRDVNALREARGGPLSVGEIGLLRAGQESSSAE